MSSEFRYLVRIRGKDLEGRKKLVPALADLRGVGDNFAQSIVSSLGLDPKMRLGTLSDSQLKELERVLIDGSSLKVPQWALNRRRDPETGETKQLVGTDLDFALKSDIDREKTVQSWRGIRYSLGLKVRGQRTRTTGRKGRTVGVRKSALQAAAAAKGKEEEKK
ncbi:MAG: 30S ribosomal protein S13 [Nitrososphaerota archaeon]|nr:30S ribosomal protein S13 [Nitrososphaerota archaeon]